MRSSTFHSLLKPGSNARRHKCPYVDVDVWTWGWGREEERVGSARSMVVKLAVIMESRQEGAEGEGSGRGSEAF